MARMGYLYSKANYPVTLKYNGKDLIIPPNAQGIVIGDVSKLGFLPPTIRKVEKGGK